MNRPRDSFRERVYSAELLFLEKYGKDKIRKFETVEDVQKYVDRLTNSVWWMNRWPSVKHITVVSGRAFSCSTAYRIRGQTNTFCFFIKISCTSFNEHVVLHEVCHIIVPAEQQAHGREYCRNLLNLIYHQLGNEAGDILRSSFVEKCVKYSKPWLRPDLKGKIPPWLLSKNVTSTSSECIKI